MRELVATGELLQGEPLVAFEQTSRQKRETTIVQRLTLRTRTRQLGVYVKYFRDSSTGTRGAMEQAESEYRELRRVERAFTDAVDVGVVHPVALLPNSRALATLEATGTPLHALLSREARRLGGTITRERLQAIGANIADWLRRYQSLSPPQTIAVDDLRQYCAERLIRLEQATGRPWTSRDTARVLDRFDSLADRLSFDDRLAVDLHADFTLENVLVDGTRITALDFVGGRRGMRVHDLAHLLMQLDIAARKPWLDSAAIRELQRALISGYDPSLTRESPALQIALLTNVLARMVHRASLRGSWLQRKYSEFLWHSVEQAVVGARSA